MTPAQRLLELARTPEGLVRPHETYARLQAITDWHRDEASGYIYLLRWDQCDEALRSPAFVAPRLLQQDQRFADSPSLQFLASTLSNLDAPHHTRLRGAVQKSFSAPVIKRSKAFLDHLVAERIDALRHRTEFDVVSDYAATIPGTVICNLLGVPEADQPKFGKWLADQFRLLGPVLPSDDLLREVEPSTQALLEYTADLLQQRKREPQLDILSGLAAFMTDQAPDIDTREIAVTAAILLAGGTDTTKTAISMGTRLLLANPDQLADFLSDPTADFLTFEEVLRLGSPVILANLRVAAADTEVGGLSVSKGETVVPVLASANVDPDRFDNPLRFDIRRHPNRHMAFGGGAHVCVGNMLARMVGPTALCSLIRAFPEMRLVGGEQEINNSSPALRSLQRLGVSRSRG